MERSRVVGEAYRDIGRLRRADVHCVLPAGVVVAWRPVVAAEHLEGVEVHVYRMMEVADEPPDLGGAQLRFGQWPARLVCPAVDRPSVVTNGCWKEPSTAKDRSANHQGHVAFPRRQRQRLLLIVRQMPRKLASCAGYLFLTSLV
jgi:hypothetical protein